MRYPAWLLGSLAIVLAAGSFSGVAADSYESKTVGESSTLTIDVVPLWAEVRLDGVPLGNAHDLISQAVAVTPGSHVVEIGAPGYLTATVTVSATVDWASRIWLQLIPDRK
jgi:CRISPR/Cas system-associated exonuclease Cas4 (RecB family)